MSCTLHFDDHVMHVHAGADSSFSLCQGLHWIKNNRGTSRPDNGSLLGFKHQLHHRMLSSNAVEIWATLRNENKSTAMLRKIMMFDGWIEAPSAAWQVMHGELFKREDYFDGFSLFTGNILHPLHSADGTFGLSEDLTFPGLFFHHPDHGTILMSVLSQERCKPVWTLGHKGRNLRLWAEERWIGIPTIPVAPGQTFSSERWVIMHTPGDIHAAIEAYHKLLRRRYDFAGTNSILREAILWGSWNYNIRPRGHGDITHDYIIRNAAALKKLAKDKPAFVMIDDGYQRGCSSGRSTSFHGLNNFYPDPNAGYDPLLFPEGMRATATAIRAAGVRPAIWSSSIIRTDSELAEQHPEWLLYLEDDRRFLAKTAWLDYSQPEVRDHARRSWETIYRDWGYDGLKLDFWTEMFEVPYLRFRNTERTAIEWRNQFLQDIHELVPVDGYLLTCCNTNAGNPFVGRWSHGARTSIDIGNGSWSEVLRSAEWQTMAALFYRGDAHLCDADSFGWAANISRRENETWATLALIGGSICEIGGDLTNLTAEAEHLLSTGINLFGPRGRGWNSLFQGIGNLPATHWQMECNQGSLEAWINWRAFPKRLHLPQPVTNVWTGETLNGDILLQPHAALLVRHC